MILYILEDMMPVLIHDPMEWAEWFENSNRVVEYSEFVSTGGKVVISTVFLGIDHSFGLTDNPLLFETMVFDIDGSDSYQERYSTWEEAEAGHKAVLEKMKARYLTGAE